MTFQSRFELCLKEVELVQDQISRYDANGLTVKSWCLATCSALAAYAVVHRSAFVATLAAVAAGAFAGIELVYRCFQLRFIGRALELEAALRTSDLAEYSYALPSSALKGCWWREIARSLVQPHFTLLYAMIIGLAFLLVVALRLEWLPVLPNPWIVD